MGMKTLTFACSLLLLGASVICCMCSLQHVLCKRPGFNLLALLE
jgi:hypothetical protein